MPSFDRMGRLLAGFGLFFSGMIVGSAIYMSMHQTNFSILVKRNTELQAEIADLKRDVQNLNKFKNNQSVIKKITVRFEYSDPTHKLDPLLEQELKKLVHRKLDPVYEGHSLSAFTAGTENERNSEIRKLKEIVADQYSAKEQTYKIDATSVAIIQTEMIVYIRAVKSSSVDSFLFR